MEGLVKLAEKHIQQKVVKYARELDFLCIKINVGSQRGFPDYVFIDPQGWHCWIEFKKPGSSPRPLQIYRGTQLTERNVAVFVVDSYEKGKEIVDAMVASRIPEESDPNVSKSGGSRIITGPGTGED
jgi:hypothetical protein